MTAQLPPNLLALFAPRPPLRWVPPSDHAPEERKTAQISGIAAFLPSLDEYKQTDDYKPTESHLQRSDRLKLEKKERQAALLKDTPLTCGDPTCFDHPFIFPCPNSGHSCRYFNSCANPLIQINLKMTQTFVAMPSRL
jgi:hypothetical protein